MNQADTMDTQADADMPEFIAFLHSGKVVATRSGQSHINFLDMITGEVVLRTDIDKQDKYRMKIAFSPDEDQVVFYQDLSSPYAIQCTRSIASHSTPGRQKMSGLGRLPSNHATTWLYAPQMMTQHLCKCGIGRIPQVSNARIL